MRIVANFVGLLLCVAGAGENQTQPTSEKPFDRAVKILRFGPVNDYSKPTKGDAVVFLGLLGDDQAVPVLSEHLAHEFDANLRFQITKALAWLKSSKAVPALDKALRDEDVHVRNGAAMALTRITGKRYPTVQTPIPPGIAQELTKRLIAGANTQQPAGSSFLSLNPGETYHFVFGQPQRPALVGKVLQGPIDNWVKIQIGGDISSIAWINITTLAYISHRAGEK